MRQSHVGYRTCDYRKLASHLPYFPLFSQTCLFYTYLPFSCDYGQNTGTIKAFLKGAKPRNRTSDAPAASSRYMRFAKFKLFAEIFNRQVISLPVSLPFRQRVLLSPFFSRTKEISFGGIPKNPLVEYIQKDYWMRKSPG